MPSPEAKSSVALETPVDYAARVLFSDSLTEKLRRPGKLDFESPADRNTARDLYAIKPGRPDQLRFSRSSEARPPMPSSASLVDEASRGVLLHFFANHELLAAELMALAILRFRDAPVAFIRGLAKTLAEEQRHTGWYINRMADCGVEFGQYPVNRFFWDAVSTMECPLDYVSRLSLTFEQANLDYSRHYAGVLGEAGDPKSAAILDRIYRDEITHVGYGLRWFRRWKEESDSDWSALEKRLVFPLSPIRAKGNQIPFNEEGRRAAGFDADYIHRLELYERSRGRTPNVFYFNPEAENRAAVWPATYHPPAKVQAVIDDLEMLSLFLARRDDVVLLRRLPSAAHHRHLTGAGFHLPELEALTPDGSLSKQSLLHERKIHRFQPWSKSPDLEKTFRPLGANETNSDGHLAWRKEQRDLFSKNAQSRQLSPWFGESHEILTRADLENTLTAFRRDGIGQVVLKQSYATAGSGMRRLTLADLEALLEKGFSEAPQNNGGILLEPLHNRVFDFSVQFDIREGKARRIATVEQLIAPSGGYRGTLVMPKFCQGLDPAMARFLMTEALPRYDEGSALVSDLEAWAGRANFTGPLGVDSYLYTDSSGQLRHRPICEINPRYTMGRVAHEIRRQIAPGFGLKLEMVKTSDLGTRAFEHGTTGGLLSSGTFLLTEPTASSHFAATITIAKQRSSFTAPSPLLS